MKMVIGREEVGRAVDAVAAHETKAPVAALCFDVLSRQAEGGALFAGKEHVEARAREHGVSREDAETERGNLLTILERGPESATEYALVAAFAVAGLGPRLGQDDGALQRFVRGADWLELSSPYAVYAFVDAVLDEEAAGSVWNAAADACVAKVPDEVHHESLGAASVRVAALGASLAPAATDALGRVAKHAKDPAIRAAASFASGGISAPAGEQGSQRLRGRAGRPRRGPLTELFRYASGWAVATSALRGLGMTLGVRRPIEADLGPAGVTLRSRVTLLGRVVREREELLPFEGLVRVARDVRYPALHLLLGLTALCAGVLVGGVLAVDGARSGATWLFVVGAAVMLLGAGVDLALDVLVPGRRGRVAVTLASKDGPTFRVEAVSMEAADRFVRALGERVSGLRR